MIERVKEDLVGIQSTDPDDRSKRQVVGWELIDFVAVFMRLKINADECIRDLLV